MISDATQSGWIGADMMREWLRIGGTGPYPMIYTADSGQLSELEHGRQFS